MPLNTAIFQDICQRLIAQTALIIGFLVATLCNETLPLLPLRSRTDSHPLIGVVLMTSLANSIWWRDIVQFWAWASRRFVGIHCYLDPSQAWIRQLGACEGHKERDSSLPNHPRWRYCRSSCPVCQQQTHAWVQSCSYEPCADLQKHPVKWVKSCKLMFIVFSY